MACTPLVTFKKIEINCLDKNTDIDYSRVRDVVFGKPTLVFTDPTDSAEWDTHEDDGDFAAVFTGVTAGKIEVSDKTQPGNFDSDTVISTQEHKLTFNVAGVNSDIETLMNQLRGTTGWLIWYTTKKNVNQALGSCSNVSIQKNIVDVQTDRIFYTITVSWYAINDDKIYTKPTPYFNA